MATEKLISQEAAQGALDDIAGAFIDAIDSLVGDADLAESIKEQAYRNILTRTLEVVIAGAKLAGIDVTDHTGL